MDVRRAFAVAVFVLCSVGVSAQAPLTPTPEKSPYRNLFADHLRPQPAVPTGEMRAPAPQPPVVVCGMRMIPADPTIDPKIRVRPPAGVEHSLRTVTPSVCHPDRAHLDPNSRRR
jgi:hypothetical protein